MSSNNLFPSEPKQLLAALITARQVGMSIAEIVTKLPTPPGFLEEGELIGGLTDEEVEIGASVDHGFEPYEVGDAVPFEYGRLVCSYLSYQRAQEQLGDVNNELHCLVTVLKALVIVALGLNRYGTFSFSRSGYVLWHLAPARPVDIRELISPGTMGSLG